MVEWEVVEREPRGDGPTSRPPSRGGRWVAPLVLLVALGMVGLTALQLRRQVNDADARRHADVARALRAEEQALRFHLVERARELAVPSADTAWLLRYAATFPLPHENLPEPELVAVEQVGADLILATVGYGEGWASLRAYRQVEEHWRRDAVPTDGWEPSERYTSPNFTLWLDPRDRDQIDPFETLDFLERFRLELETQWPIVTEAHVTIRVEAEDLAPAVLGVEVARREVRINSPLLAAPSVAALDPDRGYRLALAGAVAETLAVQSGRSVDELQLRRALLEALARYILLTEEEQARYREIYLSAPGADGSGADWRALLPDYLVLSEGPDALVRLAVARGRSVSLPAALLSSFGQSLNEYIAEMQLWREIATAPGGDDTATLLRIVEEEPFAAVAIRPGQAIPARLEGEGALLANRPLPCIGRGSQLQLQDGVIRTGLVEPPSWPLNSLVEPDALAALLLLERERHRMVVALSESSRLDSLLILPPGVEFSLHPSEPRLAFLYQDRCGTTVNRLEPGRATLLREPASPRGTPHLIWLGDALYLLDDLTTLGESRWSLARVGEEGFWELEPPEGQGLERVLASDPARGTITVRLEDRSLARLKPAAGALDPLPFRLPADAHLSRWPVEGRWIGYRVAGDGGREALMVGDLGSNSLDPRQIVEGERLGDWDLRLDRLGQPQVVSVLHAAGATLDADRLLLSFPYLDRQYPLALQVERARWCASGEPLLQVEREGQRGLLSDLDGRGRYVPVDGTLLWCR